jgi:tetratricopeptide (TPR) repeat protein
MKGLCLAREGRMGEAEGAYAEALALDPQLFVAHAQRADLLMTMGRPEDALTAYLRAAALRPDDGHTRIKAGLILLDLNRREDGKSLLKEAARLDPEAAPRAREILQALEREERGEPLTREASPGQPGAHPPEESAGQDLELEFLDAGVPLGRGEANDVATPAEASPTIELVESPASPETGAAAQPGPAETPRLTVCLIVINEEERLPGCLDSVAGVADEIVVCDTGSTDRTIEVAQLRGARIVELEWKEDFAAARNAALARATGDWILVLDADERLDPDSAARLKDLIASGEADGYNVMIDSPVSGDIVQRFVGNYCRLFRRHDDARFEGRVHEQIYPALRRLGYTVVPSGIRIEHLGYSLDPEALERKKRRNLALLEREIAERPGDHFVQFNLGIAYFSLRDLERAEPALRSAIRQSGQVLPHEVVAIAQTRLSQCAVARGDLAQAGRDATNALALSPESALPRFILATIATHHQRYDEAAREFGRILELSAVTGDAVDRFEVCREMGVCLYRAGRHREAAEAFGLAAPLRPKDAAVRFFLGNALARAGDLEGAWTAYRDAVRLDPALSEAKGNLEVVARELGYKYYDSGRYQEALGVVPQGTRDTELLFLDAISRHSLGDYAGARGSLEALNELDGGFAEAHWNLALVCKILGDLTAAREALERFRRLAPGDARAQALEETLAMEGAQAPETFR